jgi:hypothetical protein
MPLASRNFPGAFEEGTRTKTYGYNITIGQRKEERKRWRRK